MVILAGLTSMNAGAHADAWNSVNDPAQMDSNYEYTLSKLPLEAQLENKPWSETYWETAIGSINLRWNLPQPVGFNYELYTRDELLHMTKDEIATLSPSEKFDIYRSHYDYPLHTAVLRFANPHVATWRGICNGWSMSAIQYAEPGPKEVTNADGIVIPFGASDIKALLSYYAQFASGVQDVFVGAQCTNNGLFWGTSACKDINPGAMHVVLANQLGLKKQPVLMDRDPGAEIWNQPIFGYESKILGSAQSSAAQGILVQTTIFYTDELQAPSWKPVNNTPQFTRSSMVSNYILDLDASGRIVGGSYVNNSDHPDYFWLPKTPVEIDGDFTLLNTLLK